MQILKIIGILLFVTITGCVGESGITPKYQDDSQNLTENWQYRWGDSPFNSYGAPVWTLEDLDK